MFEEDYFRSLVSSPQSYDIIEQTKKQQKRKKRRVVHKHLLNHNILLEKDLSRLTARQKILQKKFQSKKNEMGNIDLIRSGIDPIPYNSNNKMVFKSKYKVKLPVYSKLRIKIHDNPDELIIQDNTINDVNEENFKITQTLFFKNQEELFFRKNQIVKNDFFNLVDKNLISNLLNSKEKISLNYIAEKNIKTDKLNLNEKKQDDIVNSKKRQLCLYKDEFNQELYQMINKKKKTKSDTRIVLYKKFNIQDLFNKKPIKKLTRLSLDDVDIYEANHHLFVSETEGNIKNDFLQDEILNKLEMINFAYVNKKMLIKKRRVLFKSEKKFNVDCTKKAAFYITELENIPRYNQKIEKKCIYYTDILIKEFKRKGCVCKVSGEVKWWIKKTKEEYAIGNLSI